jgi:high-affinity iron transporter
MTSIFLQSATILLREGLEALLVIAALAAYLNKVGAQRHLTALYGGAGFAVVASLIAAWLFETLNNGAHDDKLEGAVLILAALLMLYVSGWLLLRQDPRAWQSYLQEKADVALSRGTGIAVGTLAFLAVFREGAETVLFLHALAKTVGGWSAALLAGLVAAAVALAVLFFFINMIARRIPLRLLFILTSAFLFIMALKFIGAAAQEFQEQQLLPYHELGGWSWLSAIGFNPTVEALTAQAVVVVLAVFSFAMIQWSAADPSRAK